ncbi:MAG: GIY-YIG nuclease family protein [Clostridia bacterium]|nr:GIY-YIG nuclease family protein [Clostridia bacterium]
MREEAAERRELERQRQQLEKESSKYNAEIEALKAQVITESDSEKNSALLKRISELESMVAGLNEKKEEIVNLANGKAGHVYVISNLGAFGDQVFKVGMTRRLDPQERIDELGNASVPFNFDVHSLIFSDNAVGLEAALHEALNDKRVNKVNLRKEFFRTTLDELEQLVFQYDPSASFNRTMLAEQYRQTLAIENNLIEFDPNATEGDSLDDDE